VPAPPAIATRPAAPAPATAAPSAGDGRALLAQGALPEAARAFSRSLAAGSRSRYSVQLLTACSPENVQKAVSAGGSELFILPVSVKGQTCYRVCWGLFDGRSGAEAALAGLPAYFRQSGVRPRLSTVAELAP
jgi:septal ring-binding cell division protein DamX